MLRLSCLCAGGRGGWSPVLLVFCVSRGGTPRFGSSTLQGVCSLFSFCFRYCFAFRSLPCINLLLRCPVLPSLLLFSFHCRSLPLQPLRSPVWPSPSGLGPYVCVSVSWFFVFALSPLLLVLFCCLHCSVSDIGFLAFASTQRSRWGLLVVVAVSGVRAVGL